MRAILSILSVFFFVGGAFAQISLVKQKLEAFLKDDQLQYAQVGFGVMDLESGALLLDHNANVGMVPASSLKVLTAISAFDILGKDFRFETHISSLGFDSDSAYLDIDPSGDPSFGSPRFETTKASVILDSIFKSLSDKEIKHVSFHGFHGLKYSYQAIPDDWSFEDIGNYYGAGAYALNWKENVEKVVMRSGKKLGDEVAVMAPDQAYRLELKTGAKGSGDQSYVYPQVGAEGMPFIKGSIPLGENSFEVKAAMLQPEEYFKRDLEKYLSDKGIGLFNGLSIHSYKNSIYKHRSPALTDLMTAFLNHSINLYGEAFLKRMAFERKGFGATETGVDFLREYWQDRGIDKNALNIKDGSGLSPTTRITVRAQLQLLQYASGKDWFASLDTAMPLVNGLKMKSGTLSGVKAYTGWVESASGKKYAFSILVNNFNGSSSKMAKKMRGLLASLKSLH